MYSGVNIYYMTINLEKILRLLIHVAGSLQYDISLTLSGTASVDWNWNWRAGDDACATGAAVLELERWR
jgi:hypothetical protein